VSFDSHSTFQTCLQLHHRILPKIRSGALIFGAAAFLTACVEGTTRAPVTYDTPQTQDAQSSDPAGWVQPSYLGGQDPVRVAVLLPFSAQAEQVQSLADAMLGAAELALFDQGSTNVVLMPKDTRGTPTGASAAAQEAIDQGAEIILGPLFSTSVASVAPIARRFDVPVVAFSTDRNVAGDGVYLLSFMPENEIETVTQYARRNGITAFGALYPFGPYGDRVAEAFETSVAGNGGVLVQAEYYERESSQMFEPVKRLTSYAARVSSLETERANLRAAGDEASQAALQRLEQAEVWGSVGFQAVLIPEEGNLLRALAPLLPYYGVDQRAVRFLGTGLWDNPDIVREPSLVGGWFAAPSPDARQAFASNYQNLFGTQPPRISSLAYDAVMLTSTLASEGARGARFDDNEITNPNGFFGIDGLFRFFPDGSNERGLSIIEVTQDGFKVIEPAPTSFQSPGF